MITLTIGVYILLITVVLWPSLHNTREGVALRRACTEGWVQKAVYRRAGKKGVHRRAGTEGRVQKGGYGRVLGQLQVCSSLLNTCK